MTDTDVERLHRRIAELEADNARLHIGQIAVELAASRAALHTSETSYRLVVESAIDFAIFTMDLRRHITSWNTGAERVLGWPEHEALGQAADMIFTAADRAAGVPEQEARGAVEQGRAEGVRWHVRRDGSPLWASGLTLPLRDTGGAITGLLKIFRDQTAQKRSEEQLRDAAGFLARLLESSADRITVLDLDGRIVSMSASSLALLEIDDSEPFRGRPWTELWPREAAEAARDAVVTARCGGTGRFAGFAPTMKGTSRWWDAEVTPILDGEGRPERLLAVSRDVTRQHRAEEQLRAGEARLRLEREFLDTLIRQAPIGILITEAGSGSAVVLNDQARKLIGHDELGTDACRYEAYGALHGDGTPYAVEDYPTIRALRHGEVVQNEEIVYRQGGAGAASTMTRRLEVSSTPIRDEAGSVAAAVTILQDVEEKRRLQDALRQINERLEHQVEDRTRDLRDSQDFARLALSSVGGVGVWTYDVASDRFFCNAAISELYGLDATPAAAGISRVDFLAHVHPDDLPRLRSVMAGGQERSGDLELEYRIRHPDGSVRWVLSRGHTYVDDTGRAVRRVGIGVETTKRRELEEQLRQSQKMEAVGQLTGGLAHDFNNLLTAITGSLELLQVRLTQGRITSLARYITLAQTAANRAAALTHRLLAFSRRQTLDPKPTDVNRLIGELEDLIRRTVGPAIEVEVAGAGGLPTALVDPNQLENALLNLCLNARDAMPHGGRLTIETNRTQVDKRMARDLDMPEAEYLTLCVTDTGTGMSPEVKARAFDPFFTTKPLGEGTGLGLSMIYGFARQSGGQVRIYSEVGQGTTVCLYVPPHLGEADLVVGGRELNDAPRSTQGETVLVVDDEPIVRMLVAEVLGDLGYTAVEAADGAAGLHILRSDARIDMLVTDVGLPGGMNGRQMADAGRMLRPELKVLFITGYAESAVVGNGYLEAGMHVMTKPFAMEVLATRIKALITGA